MEPIQGLNQILEILRQKMAARTARTERTAEGPESATKQSLRHTTPRQISIEEIGQRVGDRLLMLDPADQAGRKGAQVFVESILAWRFGEDLLQDPGFADMSREIQDAMTGDPQVWQRMQDLLRQLVSAR
jgi:hypothetical protein